MKPKTQSKGLFDPPEENTTPESASQQEDASRSVTADTASVRVIGSCPRCGRKALKSVRPQEYGGLTMYCPQCPGETAYEPFRFTPEEGIPF